MKSITVTINGQSYSKCNSRIFTYRGGKPLLIKNNKVSQFVDDAILQLKPQIGLLEPFEGTVKLEADIYYKTKLSDLDISLIQDILQQQKDKKTGYITFKGVYLNDRQVHDIHIRKHHDKENPRAIIRITEIDDK